MGKVAVLDDYLAIVEEVVDWSALPPGFEARFFADHLTDEDAIADRLREFDVVIGMRERTPFPRSLLEKLPKLSLLVTLGSANASFDLNAATELGIVVSGTGASGPDPIELTWGLILAVARNIPREDSAMRNGHWQTSIGFRLAGKTLGIAGLGRIGSRVAAIGKAFGMPMIAWSPNMTAERAAQYGAQAVTKEGMLRWADVLTMHLRLSDRTRGCIGAPELAIMKPTACLINTARGPLVDEAALIDALRSGRIAAAALDVFDQEPLPADHPLRYLENTVITPHLGGVTWDRYHADYNQAIEDVRSYANGTPLRVLNSDVLERPNLRRLT